MGDEPQQSSVRRAIQTGTEERHQDLNSILGVAQASHAFIQKVITPLITTGILAIIIGAGAVYMQVHDMSRDMNDLRKQMAESNAKVELLMQVYYAGGFDHKKP